MVAILAGNTLLRPLVNRINRTPMVERSAEATYEVHVLTQAEHVGENFADASLSCAGTIV